MCRSSGVSRSLEPNPGLACIEGCVRHAVLRETREEPFERPLPDLIVNPQDVVVTADAQTFPKEGELCLRILAKLDERVHCADDICLAQELVRDELRRPDSNCECVAAGGRCGSFGQAPGLANFPLRRCCVQVVHVVDDFRFQWVPLSSDSSIGKVEVLKKRQHQDWVT